ncbi:MAG: hypothetical protein ACYDHF_06855 [Candidatus Cryosericum sp.]
MSNHDNRVSRSPGANLGILLIVIGIVVLALQYLHIDVSWLPARWAELSWPLRIIVPGLALFVAGLILPGGAGEGLSGLGLVAAAVGVLLWYQGVTGTWSSWAYAWALVFPAAGGLAGIIHGTIHANWRHVREGAGGLVFGLVMFVVLGYVFERWLGFGGFGFDRIAPWIPGVILLGVGVIVLFAGTPGERHEREQRTERRERRSDGPQTTFETHQAPQGWTAAPSVPPQDKKMETITPAEPPKPEDKPQE